ncbi:MAG TPA: ribosome biogenesis GTPase Der [Rhabdochlamydiaceae bacterium]|nr:ribosome biogenesis GTPase Der [Rhabdochlamydiaceae bacterium]
MIYLYCGLAYDRPIFEREETMDQHLKLAIVGRPNVGKSALFNRICKKKIAIVDEAEGVTRDRLYAEAECFGRTFQVIDTGGIDSQSKLPFQEEVRRQAEIAIVEADVLVMVVDAKIGITTLDEQVASMLLRVKKPVCLAVNKIDDFSQHYLLHQFYGLGIDRIVAVSAAHGFQIAELLETAFEGLVFPSEQSEKETSINVAIVGRPNVGKSTLVNHLMQEDRCVVSPIAGTTRDSIDVQFEADGTLFTLIDTAGIRRKKSEHEVVDKFAAIRTERAIERSDICVLMVEAQSGLTAQEKGIARQIEESGKGCILLFNKWDLVKGFRMEHCLKTIREQVPFLSHCPALFVSAKTGRNLDDLFRLLKEVHTQQTRRITTGQLNKFIEKVLQKYHPPMLQGKRLRIYYMAQVDVHPPKFVLFVNHPELMCETYKKYIINQFREEYGFQGVPLIFVLKGRQTKEEAANRRHEAAEEEECVEEEECLQ